MRTPFVLHEIYKMTNIDTEQSYLTSLLSKLLVRETISLISVFNVLLEVDYLAQVGVAKHEDLSSTIDYYSNLSGYNQGFIYNRYYQYKDLLR